MIPEVDLEALHCLDRTSLEGLQIHARYLRNMVYSNAHKLPLRRIHGVGVAGGMVSILLNEETTALDFPANEQHQEELFHRVNNAFVAHMGLNFHPEDRPFLFFLRAGAKNLQCRVQILRMDRLDTHVDYAMVDFLGRCMQPHGIYAQMNKSAPQDSVMLFTRESMRDSVSHVTYMFRTPPVPICLIGKMLSADEVKTYAISVRVDPRPWVSTFIEEFEALSRVARTVDRVALIHRRRDTDSPLEDMVHGFERSPGADVPTPGIAFIPGWSASVDQRVTDSDTSKRVTFKNCMANKRLELYTWSANQAQTRHRVYLLHIVDA